MIYHNKVVMGNRVLGTITTYYCYLNLLCVFEAVRPSEIVHFSKLSVG